MKTNQTEQGQATRLIVRGLNRHGGATITTPDDERGLHRVVAETFNTAVLVTETDNGEQWAREIVTAVNQFEALNKVVEIAEKIFPLLPAVDSPLAALYDDLGDALAALAKMKEQPK